ncbi:MAG: PKD domain-containing protein [Bacteroidota bacterium]
MKKILIFSAILFLLAPSFSGQTVLVIQPGPEDGKDALINSVFPDYNWGDATGLYASAWTYDGEFGIGRSAIRFDLSQIPPDAKIVEARLTFYYNPGVGFGFQSGENESYLEKITEDWNEMTVTWSNCPTTIYAGAVFIPKTQTETSDVKDVDITAFVAEWVKHPQTNFGFMHRMVTEIEYCGVFLTSSEFSDPSRRPKLVMKYIDCDSPVAAFGSKVQIPLVSFTDSSSHADSWFWDFGDGYFSNLQNPMHSYAQQGIYEVCLTVEDSCGSDTVCKTIKVCNSPKPAFAYISEGNMIKFADSSYQPLSWFWDFGDGFYSDLRNPEHYFNKPGTYYVCEMVVNGCAEESFCDSVKVIETGVVNHPGSFGLQIYPNPATDKTIIHLKSHSGKYAAIELFTTQMSLAGKWLYDLPSNEISISLDLSGIPAGFYFIRTEIDGIFRLDKLVIR